MNDSRYKFIQTLYVLYTLHITIIIIEELKFAKLKIYKFMYMISTDK